jgi:hypothetical protein
MIPSDKIARATTGLSQYGRLVLPFLLGGGTKGMMSRNFAIFRNDAQERQGATKSRSTYYITGEIECNYHPWSRKCRGPISMFG